MPFKMVHAHDRLAKCGGQGAGDAGAYQQCTRQARATRIRNDVNLAQGVLRLRHDLLRQWQYAANMVPAGQFWYHATIGLVHFNLAVQAMRQKAWHATARGIYQRNPGFVARRLDS